MTAVDRYADEVPKTGEGRKTAAARKIPDVESLPCPRWGGLTNHELTNTPAGNTRCQGCGTSWASLDAQARQKGMARP